VRGRGDGREGGKGNGMGKGVGGRRVGAGRGTFCSGKPSLIG